MVCGLLRNFFIGMSFLAWYYRLRKKCHLYCCRVLTNTDTQIADTHTAGTQLNTEEDNTQESLEEILADENVDEIPPDISTASKHKATEILPKTASNEKFSNDDWNEPKKKKKRKANFAGEVLSAIKKSRSERDTIISQLNSAPAIPPEDKNVFLFKSLAMTVKTFPPLLRAQIKNKLFQVISEAEVELLLPRPVQPSSRLSTYSYETSTTSSPLPSPLNREQQNLHMGSSHDQQASSDAAHFFHNLHEFFS